MAEKGKKTTKKSKEQQGKDLAKFATAVVGSAVVATKRANKGKSKKQKFANTLIAIILVIGIVLCGGMYYYDQAPFDFTIAGDAFKYYAYEDYDYEISQPSGEVIGAVAEGELRIHYIDVGQGDSIFIQFPDNKTMLIDGAKNSTTIADGIISYLTALYPDQNKVTIDYVMLTHCDSDHCGSLDNVIASDAIDVKNVYQPKVLSKYENDPLKAIATADTLTITTTVYSNFVKAVYEEKQEGICESINYNLEGMTIEGEGWIIKMYNPTENMYKKLTSAQDKNNISPIMVLRFNNTTILLTGDADDFAEQNFMSNIQENMFNDGFDGDIDVLKVAHHGGQDSTSEEFLAMTKPQYAVISVGEGNTYDHPREITLDKLANCGAQIYRTDINGNIVMTVVGNEITWVVDRQVNTSILYRFNQKELFAS